MKEQLKITIQLKKSSYMKKALSVSALKGVRWHTQTWKFQDNLMEGQLIKVSSAQGESIVRRGCQNLMNVAIWRGHSRRNWCPLVEVSSII